MSLARALEQLTARDREGALDALLEAWRALRSPEIADVIDLVSQDVTRVLPVIDGRSRLAFQNTWLDIANEGRSTDLGRLLATFQREPCTQIRDRLTRLEAREHDPRVARALCDMIVRCPCTSTPNSPMWTRIFKLLGDIGDARVNEPLEAFLKAEKEPRLGGTFHTLHRSRVTKTIAKNAPPAVLAAEDVLLVKELTRLASTMLEAEPVTFEPKSTKAGSGKEKSEAELLDLVYADPEADDPRLVYGDWLLERGHPRGEFIALQFKRHRGEMLTKAEAQRERALIADHGRRWIGPIEPVIVRDGIRFARGFLDTCAVVVQTRKEEELADHPSWSTVRELLNAPAEMIRDSVMRSLRVLRVGSKAASSVARRTPRVEELHVSVPNNTDQGELDNVVHADAYPGLRRLSFAFARDDIGRVGSVRPIDFHWLLNSKIVKRVEHLGIQAYWYDRDETARPDLGAWLEALQPFDKLVSVALELQYYWQVYLTRASSSEPSEASRQWSLELTCAEPKYTDPFERALRNVPAATFARATVRNVHGGERIDPFGQLATLLNRVVAPAA